MDDFQYLLGPLRVSRVSVRYNAASQGAAEKTSNGNGASRKPRTGLADAVRTGSAGLVRVVKGVILRCKLELDWFWSSWGVLEARRFWEGEGV